MRGPWIKYLHAILHIESIKYYEFNYSKSHWSSECIYISWIWTAHVWIIFWLFIFKLLWFVLPSRSYYTCGRSSGSLSDLKLVATHVTNMQTCTQCMLLEFIDRSYHRKEFSNVFFRLYLLDHSWSSNTLICIAIFY